MPIYKGYLPAYLKGYGIFGTPLYKPHMYMPVCLHVSLSPLSLPLSLSLSLSICVVGLADQGSRARYRVIQFFSWDSKSVPFPTNLSWLMPSILIMHHLSVRFHFMRGSRKFCQRGSNLDNVFF